MIKYVALTLAVMSFACFASNVSAADQNGMLTSICDPTALDSVLRKGSDSSILFVQAEVEQKIRARQFDSAILVSSRYLESHDNDVHSHIMYAHALESKLSSVANRDSNLYIDTVVAWLRVLRIGQHAYELVANEPVDGIAARRLRTLVGFLPRSRESNGNYVERVRHERNVETSVGDFYKYQSSHI